MRPKEINTGEAARRLNLRLDYLLLLLRSRKIAARKQDGRWLVTRGQLRNVAED